MPRSAPPPGAFTRDAARPWDRHLSLGPILDQEEESDITVPKGFDPSVMTLTGNVTGDPPFEGQVLHRGWRVKRFNLPTLSETEDASLVAPSEVDRPIIADETI